MSPASDSGPPDAATGGRRRDPDRDPTAGGDPRWPGSTRDDLLGRRARQRSTGEVGATVVSTAAGDVAVPEVPALDGDVYRLDPDATGRRRRREAVLGPLHALALDAALSAGGDVVWIDAGGHATTRALARVAPSERALERVHVARAFTTHQHHALVESVGRWLRGGSGARGGSDDPFGTPGTDRPAVVVCPALDALYDAGDLPDGESRRLLVRALAVLAGIARDRDLPVLLTRSRADDETAPIEAAATRIGLDRTRFGPRFECDEQAFESLVYPVDEGVVQTTLAFWREILAARHPGVAGAAGDAERPTAAPTAGTSRRGR